MTICLVEMRAAPGRRDEFWALCHEGVPRALQAGCVQAEVLVDTEDADVFVVLERWPSEEAFQAFSAREWANKTLMTKLGELTVGTPTLRRLETLLTE